MTALYGHPTERIDEPEPLPICPAQGMGEGGYLFTSHEEVAKLLSSESLRPVLQDIEELTAGLNSSAMLIEQTGLEHRAARAAISSPFKRGALGSYRAESEASASRLVQALKGQQSVELLASYARPLAAESACHFLGLPTSLAPDIALWALTFMNRDNTRTRRMLCGLRLYSVVCLQLDYLLARAEEGTTDKGPVPAMESLLLRGVARETVAGAAMPVLTTGVELTARVIAAGIAGNADLCLTASDSDVDDVVADAMIIPRVERVVVHPTKIRDTTLREGNTVTLELRSGAIEDGGPTLPFGWGPHYCLGAAWVREVTRIGVSVWVRDAPAFDGSNVIWAESVPGGPVHCTLFADRSLR